MFALDHKTKVGEIKVKVGDFGLVSSWPSPSNEENQSLDGKYFCHVRVGINVLSYKGWLNHDFFAGSKQEI